jgi:hypothetical protein
VFIPVFFICAQYIRPVFVHFVIIYQPCNKIGRIRVSISEIGQRSCKAEFDSLHASWLQANEEGIGWMEPVKQTSAGG